MALLRRELLTLAKTELRISDEVIWTDVQINNAVDQVVTDISTREPLKSKIGLPIVQYTRDVDIASLKSPTNVSACTCDAAWDAQANVTCTADTTVKQEGTASAKMAIAAGFSTGLIATEVITSIDLSTYREIYLWVKSSLALAAGVLQLCLDNTATCASPLEYLNIPALTANTWTYVGLTLANPSALTAIISVGLNATSDPTTVNVWVDDIRAYGKSQTNILRMDKVEYPTGEWTPIFHHYEDYGDYISIVVSSIPTITSGTLTGIVTFTNGSRTVSGSGTLFAAELDEDYFICPASNYRWYRIVKVVSVTSLIIEQPFEEITVTDGTGTTKYRDVNSCIYLHCGREYTLTNTSSNLPNQTDNILVLGTVAYTVNAWSGEYIRSRAIAGVAKIASASTELDSVQARITQAVGDLALGKEDLEANLTALGLDLTSMTARIEAAVAYLATGDDLINAANYGASAAAPTYAQYATTELANATEYLERVRGYIQSSTSSKDYVDYATGELNGASAYIAKAGSYIAQVERESTVSDIVVRFNRWAIDKMAQYQAGLRTLGKIAVREGYVD